MRLYSIADCLKALVDVAERLALRVRDITHGQVRAGEEVGHGERSVESHRRVSGLGRVLPSTGRGDLVGASRRVRLLPLPPACVDCMGATSFL